MKWPDRRLLDLFGIDHPIIQAPMAGVTLAAMAIAVSRGRRPGLDRRRDADAESAAHASCRSCSRAPAGRSTSTSSSTSRPPPMRRARQRWRKRLAPYYREFGLPADAGAGGPVRAPFDAALCDVLLEFKPKVASFHFGLPEAALVKRLKAEQDRWSSARPRRPRRRAGSKAHGVDAVIAQGAEAGGHRGMFLIDDIAQPGRHHGAGAAGGRRGEGAGDRGRRHRRRPRHRRGAGAGRGRRADRHGISADAGGQDVGAASRGAQGRPTTTARRSPTCSPAGRRAASSIAIIREVGPMSADAPAFPLAAGAA